jgi:ribosomal protein S18 acetylase RimI-like enzyme
MADSALTRGLEERCFNAWPALRTLHSGGWVIRLSDGHTRRANSASALHPPAGRVPQIVDNVVDLFAGAGLLPAFRVSPLCARGFDAVLARRGFNEDDITLVLWAPAAEGHASPALRIEAEASPEWLHQAVHAYGFDAGAERALQRMLTQLVLPRAFASLERDGRPIGWGLAVCERGFVGLYDLVIAADWRGRGIGRLLVSGLIAWGQQQGAKAAYLQVRANNRRAIALYQHFGFVEAYRYSNWSLAPDARQQSAPDDERAS